MMPGIFCLVLIAVYVSNNLGIVALEDTSLDRQEKHFSLFSVVTFKNDECTSLLTTSSGSYVKGTCYSATECGDKSGTKSGNCASGFGVCCVFLNTAAVSATISENRTHLRNSEYPSYTTATTSTSIAYTVKKMANDICQLRLDFETFVIAGPQNSGQNIPAVSANHNCINDQMTIVTTGNTGLFPTMCGTLTGQHLYVELSPTSTDTAVITISQILVTTAPVAATAQREWDIQVSQIPCYASYRAPNGCHRYLMTDSGKIESFNFYKIKGTTAVDNGQNSGVQLASQHINTCIRRSKGMCCVGYQVCIADSQGIALTEVEGTDGATGTQGVYSEGWSIDTTVKQSVLYIHTNIGAFDAMCSDDYVEIPSSVTGKCGGLTGIGGTINTRYCGVKFGASLIYETILAKAAVSPGVCDCSEPFVVRHGSDMTADEGGDAGTTVVSEQLIVPNRGFCLDFLQEPCHS